MDVREYLRQKNYSWTEIKRPAGLQAIFDCPFCGDKKSFSINIDNGAYSCLRKNECGQTGSWSDFMKFHGDKYKPLGHDSFVKFNKVYDIPKVKSEPVKNELYEFFKKRGISETTIKAYKIGQSGQDIMFPYFIDDKLVNVKYRNINEKKFRREKNCRESLFGQDIIAEPYLIICEGEIDALSFYEYNLKAVSIPSGVNSTGWIENDWDFLQQFQTIYICMDNDNAGQSAVELLVNRLGRWRCRNIILPFKDANECLTSGITKEKFHEIVFDESRDFTLEEIKTTDNYIQEMIDYNNDPSKMDGVKTSFQEITNILKGWREEEITLWSGLNGSGKSSFLNQEIIHLAESGQKCCIGSFEMPPRKYLNWLMKQYLKKGKYSNTEIEVVMNHFSDKILIIDITGEITHDKLFSLMEFASRKYGVKHFVIDSLMKISMSTTESKLLNEQRKLFSDFKNFVCEFKTHLHVVAHPRKGANDSEIPDKSSVSGSADITNLVDNVIILHRMTEEQKEKQIKDNKTAYDTLWLLKKHREHGTLGAVGFFFDPESKRFATTKYDLETKDFKSLGYLQN